MKRPLTGGPEAMKRLNLGLVRKALRELVSATRAELAARTGLSLTTVRAVMEELERTGETLPPGLDESSGGRRARRYSLNPDKNLSLSLFFEAGWIRYRLDDLLGRELCSDSEPLGRDAGDGLLNFIAAVRRSRDLAVVGLGVPGIVEAGRYFTGRAGGRWAVDGLGDRIERATGLPVLLENDLNAIALGYADRLAAERGRDGQAGLNLAYIHFNRSCTGAGLVADGRIVRGAGNFAGELGFMPLEGRSTLDELLRAAKSPGEALEVIARAIAAVNCVVNPGLVVVGGDRFEGAPPDRADLEARLSRHVAGGLAQPEIVVRPDHRADYLAGLSRLAAGFIQSLRE